MPAWLKRDWTVPDREASRQVDFEQTSERLSESLKTCRNVFEHYRGILAGDQPGDGARDELQAGFEEPAA